MPDDVENPNEITRPLGRWRKVCAACRTVWSNEAWSTLPLVRVIEPRQTQAHLTVPTEARVEVRSCTCGASLAAMSR